MKTNTITMTAMIVAASASTLATRAWAGHDGCAPRAVECYAKVRAPAVYATVERPVVVAPARTGYAYDPAIIQHRPYRVVVAPQQIYREHVPAAYATVMRRRLVEPARVAYMTTPAVVQRVHETVSIARPSVQWQPARDDHGRERLCKIVVPGETRTIVRDVVVSPAHRVPVTTPAIYRETPVRVLVKPAHTRHIVEPAVYALANRRVVLKPAVVRIIGHPPVIGVERHRVQVGGGGYAWARVSDHD